MKLTFATIWANLEDDRLIIFSSFFLENTIWHFVQIVFNLHKMSKPVFLGQPKKYFNSMMSSAENFTKGPKRKKTSG